ncbi:MAG TPA: CysB family HTH-type transcriptional regulator [Paracoccaceae bacterium]|nr:CysB family HTH-type transcriptional regulator [Paracoccaceae bacterium]
MNFQQLRIIREAVRRQFNLTEVAAALFTAQSGVSKHIRDLEDELGIEIFERRGKRLLGLTEPGRELAAIVERMLLDAENIRRLADQYRRQDEGELTIAATHTQARYALPPVIARFIRAYPRVQLSLHQGSPEEINQMLLDGRADIGVATEALSREARLVSFPFYSWRHAVVVPKTHPLASSTALSLAELAEQPIITYDRAFTGRGRIDEAFREAGLAPQIVMTAVDSDVIKTYVEIGLGIGIIASIAFQPDHDIGLHLIPADHLFAENIAHLATLRGRLLRGYALHFFELCNPDLSRAAIVEAQNRHGGEVGG